MSKQATVEGRDLVVTRELRAQLTATRAQLAAEPDKYSERAEKLRLSIEALAKRLAKRGAQ